MGTLVHLNCVTSLDIPVDRVLESAKDQLTGVVLMGYDLEGELYFSSSYADGGDVLWLIEKTKKRLMEVGEREI